MVLKKGDFVEVEYTGTIKEANIVFDTTDEAVAKEHNLYSEGMSFKPLVICLGEGHILAGLDSRIEGKELGSYTFELKPEEAFGKKNPKLIQLINTNKFLEQDIKPIPGLQVSMDGTVGTVRSVTGGRTLVDFNHPLAGREVIYNMKLNRLVTDKKEQIDCLLLFELHTKAAEITIDADKAIIAIKDERPAEFIEKAREKMSLLIGIKEIGIAQGEPKKG